MNCAIPQGAQQKFLWECMLRGMEVPRPAYPSWKASAEFTAMLHRAEEEGYAVVCIPGPRGGKWSARYSLAGYRWRTGAI